MAFANERRRFWAVVILLLAGAVGIGYRLVAVHLKLVDIAVRDPRYWFTREIPGLRGGIYSDRGGRQPFACSVPVWEYHVDPKSPYGCHFPFFTSAVDSSKNLRCLVEL